MKPLQKESAPSLQVEKISAATEKLFTQLIKYPTAFGHQLHNAPERLSQYRYIATLFTNVKIRGADVPAYIKLLSDTFRRIVNNDIRYRQRQDDLPAAKGVRAFGVSPLGGGWWSPNIKVACNNAKVLEYICRQWCKRTQQYPHILSATFRSSHLAKRALPSSVRGTYTASHADNISLVRNNNIVTEEYYISYPYRIEYYIACEGCQAVEFGAACKILCTKDINFDNLNFSQLHIRECVETISDCFAVNGVRCVQSWGHDRAPKELRKERHPQKSMQLNDSQAARYYRSNKIGSSLFNPYIYAKLKAKDFR